MNDAKKTAAQHEPEFSGPAWKNPYIIYIGLTLGLFFFLILLGYLAWTNGWIPNRNGAVSLL